MNDLIHDGDVLLAENNKVQKLMGLPVSSNVISENVCAKHGEKFETGPAANTSGLWIKSIHCTTNADESSSKQINSSTNCTSGPKCAA